MSTNCSAPFTHPLRDRKERIHVQNVLPHVLLTRDMVLRRHLQHRAAVIMFHRQLQSDQHDQIRKRQPNQLVQYHAGEQQQLVEGAADLVHIDDARGCVEDVRHRNAAANWRSENEMQDAARSLPQCLPNLRKKNTSIVTDPFAIIVETMGLSEANRLLPEINDAFKKW